ncbi:hypothetical protein CURTO8I2_140066 [Curtobacterium sp. 8I-2]|nr:hypothetical protein CURTO8I2_140066 [Curtobacterium sp. 8I-2]
MCQQRFVDPDLRLRRLHGRHRSAVDPGRTARLRPLRPPRGNAARPARLAGGAARAAPARRGLTARVRGVGEGDLEARGT